MDLEFVASENPAVLRDTEADEVVGRVEYHVDEDGRYFLNYLWVNPDYRGQGMARRTLDPFTEHVRDEGAKITPICGVAKRMMEGDERYEDLLD